MAILRGKNGLLRMLGIVWLALFGTSLCPYSPYFRAWEVLREGPVAFRPLAQIGMLTRGDLGRNSWVTELMDERWCRFTTDAAGLRNPPEMGWARIVLVGDSYVVGSGLDDRETISACMSRTLGEPVYNHGCVAGLGPLAYLGDSRSLDYPPDAVVWAPAFRAVEPLLLPPDPNAPVAAPSGSPENEFARYFERSLRDRLRAASDALAAWKSQSEERSWLVVLSRYVFHESYWRLTGRPWEMRALEVDGRQALVMTLEAQGLCAGLSDRRYSETIETIDRFRREVTRRGSRFIFAPIPDVGTLYAHLYDPAERARLTDPAFLDVVFRDLAKRGVVCVDLRPVLKASLSPYLFLRDDTHLSPRGAEVVARQLADAVRTVLAEAAR